MAETTDIVGPNASGWRAVEVIQILQALRKGEPLKDGVKLGLLLEGGALRGVLSCGYAAALAKWFDYGDFARLYGASSGALNGVYFVTQQLDIGQSIYVENATDRRCINRWRFPNVLDVDWLLDEWVFGAKKFDADRFHRCATPFTVSLTDVADGTPHHVIITNLNIHKLRKCLKATSYAPLLTNATQQIDGHEYTDGAASDSVPYDKAVADGCTHLVCLLTRPRHYRKKHSRASDWFESLRLINSTRAFREAYLHRGRHYNRVLDQIYLGSNMAIPTLAIHPANKTEVPSNIETRAPVILEMVNTAKSKAFTQLGGLFGDNMGNNP